MWQEKGIKFPGSKEFASEFKKTFGKKPSYQAAAGYASGQIMAAAIDQTGSLDKKKIRDALATMDTFTIFGRYGVDSTGMQARHFALVTQWQNGELEVVGPTDIEAVTIIPPIFK